MDTGRRTAAGRAAAYRERLWPSRAWWWLGGLFALGVGIVFLVVGPLGALRGFLGAAIAVAAGLTIYAAEIVVTADGLAAGRAHLPWSAVGRVRPLSPTEALALRGRDADVRAFLLLRAYVPTAVVVEVTDPADPTPYWFVSTRHPEALAAALRQPAARG
jgi:hypothetical protein